MPQVTCFLLLQSIFFFTARPNIANIHCCLLLTVKPLDYVMFHFEYVQQTKKSHLTWGMNIMHFATKIKNAVISQNIKAGLKFQ